MSSSGWADSLSLFPRLVAVIGAVFSLMLRSCQARSSPPFPQPDTAIWPAGHGDEDLRPPVAPATFCRLWIWPVWATELHSSTEEEEGRSLEWASPLAIASHPAAEAALLMCAQAVGPRAC